MKITKLHINEYRHLQEVHFDFTYPAGHSKAGEPLDKICIIGQSATGKTSVLELLKHHIGKMREVEVLVDDNKMLIDNCLDFNGKLEFLHNKHNYLATNIGIYVDGNLEYQIAKINSIFITLENFLPNIKLIYESSDIISNETIQLLNANPLTILNLLAEQRGSNKNISAKNNQESYLYEFKQEMDTTIWFSLLSKILAYRKSFTEMAAQLINKGAIGDLTKLNEAYKQWATENKNPLEAFATAFNPILNKLNLEIDLINTEYAIPIKSKKKDTVIPISELSTGTKGLLLSVFPLFELETNNAVILIDEPERSLFPDVQMELMEMYQKLAPNAQFIVATHSPFVAASFEPEERFILYFNEEGNVVLRRGESPIGDDPNNMISKDFKVNYYNAFGNQAYQDYINIKRQIVQTEDVEQKKKLMVAMAELGDKYNF